MVGACYLSDQSLRAWTMLLVVSSLMGRAESCMRRHSTVALTTSVCKNNQRFVLIKRVRMPPTPLAVNTLLRP